MWRIDDVHVRPGAGTRPARPLVVSGAADNVPPPRERSPADHIQVCLDQLPDLEWIDFLAWIEGKAQAAQDYEVLQAIAQWRLRWQLS